jgi:hypothetical protein
MSRVHVQSTGPEDWKRYLAKPDLHWAVGRSARSVAHSWEAQTGAPPEVEALLASTCGPVELLLAVPEHKTPLPGGRRESQTDVLALFRTGSGLLVAAVEGKVDESFGPLVAEWRRDGSPGKVERLAYLCDRLGLEPAAVDDLHYQLLHRTASALIEAERFSASGAAMIVHSFSPALAWFDAFARFCERLGAQPPAPGEAAILDFPRGAPLILGWAKGDPRFLSA